MPISRHNKHGMQMHPAGLPIHESSWWRYTDIEELLSVRHTLTCAEKACMVTAHNSCCDTRLGFYTTEHAVQVNILQMADFFLHHQCFCKT